MSSLGSDSMDIKDIMEFEKAVPEHDQIAIKSEKRMQDYFAKQNFSLYDSEIAEQRKKDYFFMEENFFKDVMHITKKYIENVPEIKFLPRRKFDFNVSVGTLMGEKIIFAEELVVSFLTEFSCIAFFLAAKYTEKDEDIKVYKRHMVALIDIFVCRKKNSGIDNVILEAIGKNDHSTKFACFMARAMYTYMLCHEVAHAALCHEEKIDYQQEFDADALGYELFYCLILNWDELKYLEFFPGLRRAPLALFDIFDLVEYFKREILEESEENPYHPLPYLRKAHLLDSFDFGDDEESFNLYLVISEQVSALKYYIYKHKETMRKEIKKIHADDNF